MSLPGAAELFRSTTPGPNSSRSTPRPGSPAPDAPGNDASAEHPSAEHPSGERPAAEHPGTGQSDRRLGESRSPGDRALRAVPHHGLTPAPPSGDEPRQERVNVRLSSDLLLELERTRTSLAREHGLPVSRGELVSAALSIVLEDYDAWGADSVLIRRLADD